MVAHSLGGLAALLAAGGDEPMPHAYPFQAFVLVATPNRFSEVTRKVGARLGLSSAAQRAYEQRLERLARRKLADFTGANLLAATERPALLLHSRDDAEVPFDDGQEIAASCALAELRPFDGLGHRKVLYAPPLIHAAVDYLAFSRQRTRPGVG